MIQSTTMHIKTEGTQGQTSTDTDYKILHSLLQGPLPLDYDSTSFLRAR